MKSKLITIALTLTLALTLALATPPKVQAADDACGSISKLAASIMMARQQGASMREMYQIADTVSEERVKKATILMINDAYEQPHYSTGSMQLITTRDFENKWFGLCKQSK